MADQKKPLFAAIPLQAIGHRALSASHFHVLAAIAWHDQLGANGIGCYAGLKRLAWEPGLAETTVSECTGDLEALGLLTKTRNPRSYQSIPSGSDGEACQAPDLPIGCARWAIPTHELWL